jgi:hypothetical protein
MATNDWLETTYDVVFFVRPAGDHGDSFARLHAPTRIGTSGTR